MNICVCSIAWRIKPSKSLHRSRLSSQSWGTFRTINISHALFQFFLLEGAVSPMIISILIFCFIIPWVDFLWIEMLANVYQMPWIQRFPVNLLHSVRRWSSVKMCDGDGWVLAVLSFSCYLSTCIAFKFCVFSFKFNAVFVNVNKLSDVFNRILWQLRLFSAIIDFEDARKSG